MKKNIILTIIFCFIFKIPISIAKESLSLTFDDIDVVLTGNFIQGGLVIGKTNSSAPINFKNRELRKSKDGLFVIGFGRDHPQNANLTLKVNNKLITKSFKIQKRIYKTQKINGLKKKMVSHQSLFGTELKKKIK